MTEQPHDEVEPPRVYHFDVVFDEDGGHVVWRDGVRPEPGPPS